MKIHIRQQMHNLLHCWTLEPHCKPLICLSCATKSQIYNHADTRYYNLVALPAWHGVTILRYTYRFVVWLEWRDPVGSQVRGDDERGCNSDLLPYPGDLFSSFFVCSSNRVLAPFPGTPTCHVLPNIYCVLLQDVVVSTLIWCHASCIVCNLEMRLIPKNSIDFFISIFHPITSLSVDFCHSPHTNTLNIQPPALKTKINRPAFS